MPPYYLRLRVLVAELPLTVSANLPTKAHHHADEVAITLDLPVRLTARILDNTIHAHHIRTGPRLMGLLHSGPTTAAQRHILALSDSTINP